MLPDQPAGSKYQHHREFLDDEAVAMSRLDVRLASAACAGCVSWFVIYPFDVIKARLQADRFGIKYAGSWDCFIKTWREGGVGALYRGLTYTLIRAGPVAATVLPLYEFTKEYLEKKI
jgi:hypothetical protein